MEKSYITFTKNSTLILIAVGVWILVFQNLGIIPVSQKVKITNTVDVDGSVRVNGSVDARIDNTVDINIARINGYKNVFFNIPIRDEKDKYFRLPISN
jgi:hypothetical protein